MTSDLDQPKDPSLARNSEKPEGHEAQARFSLPEWLVNLLKRVPGDSWIWVALAAVCGALAAGLVALEYRRNQQGGQTEDSAMFLGSPLALRADAPSEALRRLREHVRGLFTLELPGDSSPASDGQTQETQTLETQTRSFGDLGVEIDKSRLAQLLRDSVDRTSPLNRWRRRHGHAGSALVLPVPLHLNRNRALQVLSALKDEYDRAPVDARLDLEHRAVAKSREGLLLDIDESYRRLEQALERGETKARLAFLHLPPTRETAQLADVKFDNVIASFATNYDRAERSASRTYNLRLAASRLDGTVLLPGEVFDFNRVVGPRDEANGYRVAPVIAQGELVDGIGGGTCQVSGTLHGAAVLAGLKIVERSPHTRPSSYIKLGLDATVVYPTINYRFENPFSFPIVLHETVKDGAVRAEILGPDAAQTVTLIRRIREATPYEQVEREEPRLARGKQLLVQRGVPGFKVRMYRILRHGPHARRERWDMTYPPTTQVVARGTGGKEATGAGLHGDSHPEYTADELMILTLLPKGSGATELQETREPGSYGAPGWTERAEMPFFRDH